VKLGKSRVWLLKISNPVQLTFNPRKQQCSFSESAAPVAYIFTQNRFKALGA